MKIKKIEFEVSGMTCEHCARTIEKLFDEKDGVRDKRVNYPEAKAVIKYDAEKVSEHELANIINGSDHYRVKESVAFEIKQYASKSLIIIGGGSAAFAAAIKASEIGASVTMINDDLIGGTCVNIGCVPSKAMIKAVAALHTDDRFDGIERKARVTDYGAVTGQTQSLTDEPRQKKYIDVLQSYPNVKLIEGRAVLESENSLRVNGENLPFKRLLIATGASPYIADIPGLREAGHLDSTAVLAMKKLPKSIIVIGGRYIAVELAQM